MSRGWEKEQEHVNRQGMWAEDTDPGSSEAIAENAVGICGNRQVKLDLR